MTTADFLLSNMKARWNLARIQIRTKDYKIKASRNSAKTREESTLQFYF